MMLRGRMVEEASRATGKYKGGVGAAGSGCGLKPSGRDVTYISRDVLK